MAESSDITDENSPTKLYPDISGLTVSGTGDNLTPVEGAQDSDDKYIPTDCLENETETTGEKWNFSSTPCDDPDTFNHTNYSKDTSKSDYSTTDVNKKETKNQERRRNKRLQSGAGSDKYQNAYRFPGGHNKVNTDRPKPQPSDKKNIASGGYTGNSSSNHTTRERGNGGQSNGNAYRRQDRVHKETDDFVFFWRRDSPFSQWHPAEFTVDGRTFNCAEQFMMYNKTKFSKSGENNLSNVIMLEKDPGEQKNYGRNIPDFDYESWEAKREDVVKKGNIAKFSQNEKLREELFRTYPKRLVEASPTDQVWGIGLSAESPDALKVENWRGLNLLGKILTEVRDELLKETGFL